MYIGIIPCLSPVRNGQDHCIAPEVSAFLLLVLSLPVHIQVVRRGCAFPTGLPAYEPVVKEQPLRTT